MRRFHLPLIAMLIGMGAIIFCIAHYLTSARISHRLTSEQVRWPQGKAAFTVRDVNITAADDYTALTIQCTWDAPPEPWSRYQLGFPGGRVKYPSGTTYSDGLSPLNSPGGFVIHHYLAGKPSLLSRIDIPIQCWDSTEKRDLGNAVLSFHYWPSGNQAIIIR